MLSLWPRLGIASGVRLGSVSGRFEIGLGSVWKIEIEIKNNAIPIPWLAEDILNNEIRGPMQPQTPVGRSVATRALN